MKKSIVLLALSCAVGPWACGPDGPSQADLQAEAEAVRLDSVNQVIDASVEELETDLNQLEESLRELDELFPEEEQ